MNTVTTVQGELDAESIGLTLMHEHIFINLLNERRPDGLLNDYELMRAELSRFGQIGGRTIVDLTAAEITHGAASDPTGMFAGTSSTGYAEEGSRSPNNVLALQRLSADLGLNIVLGTGHYRDPYIDSSFTDRNGTARLSELMVRDVVEGFPSTNVRAGILGEIGADKWYISSSEERVFRAVAQAHHETGLTISTHAAKWPVGIAQLDLLAECDVDPKRIIVGHCDTVNIPEYHEALAQRGCYVQFDNIRRSSDYDLSMRVGQVMRLVGNGHLRQILLSHDVCNRAHLNINGGGGFTFVSTIFSEALLSAGLTQEEINTILVENPRNALMRA